MSVITITPDGQYIFLALERSQLPLVARVEGDLSGQAIVFNPGAGTACNVAAVPGNSDKMLFYGNFGTDVQVMLFTISSNSGSNISPPSLGDDVVNALSVNPSDPRQIAFTLNTAQDLYYTANQGATWAVWDNALGSDPTVLAMIWSGLYDPHRLLLASSGSLRYSPNQAAGYKELAAGGLEAVADIASVEVGP